MKNGSRDLRRTAFEALAACAPGVGDDGVRHWRLPLGSVAVDARVDDGWLYLAAPYRGAVADTAVPGEAARPIGAAAEPMQLLARHAGMRGAAKFALVTHAGRCRVELRAEIPLDGSPSAVRWHVAETWAVFDAVLAAGGSGGGVAGGADGDTPDMRALLAELGWPFTQRSDGSLRVDLGIENAFFQAEVDVGGGATHLAAELAAVEDGALVCREALALLLLRAAATVRLVRPVVTAAGPRFEVVLAGAPSGAEVGHALSALAVACRLFGREVEVVQSSAALAAHYCAVQRGRAAASGTNRRAGSEVDHERPPATVCRPTHREVMQ